MGGGEVEVGGGVILVTGDAVAIFVVPAEETVAVREGTVVGASDTEDDLVVDEVD